MSAPAAVFAAVEESAIPQRVALDLQLAMIAGSAPSSAFFEVRAKRPGGGMAQRFFAVREREAAADAIRGLAADREVYVGAAPRSRREGGAEAVGAAHCVWADLDRPDAAEALDGFDPPPSMVIETGTPGHAHAYWQLSAPLRAAEVAPANLRLAHALGADPRSIDPARILRPAVGWNRKGGTPLPVRCTILEPARAYTVEQVIGHLAAQEPGRPDTRGPCAASPSPRPASADPLSGMPALEYVAALTGLEIPRSRMVRCPLADHEDANASFHVGGRDEAAWRCFGCERAGGIIALAAHLWGVPVPVRGADFIAIRGALLDRFGVAA